MLGSASPAVADSNGLSPNRTAALWVAQTKEKKEYNIPAGSLVVAINRLADESGFQIVYDAEQTEGLKTRGLSGTYTPKQAFAKILEGTNLKFHFTDANNVVLEPKGEHEITLEVESSEMAFPEPEKMAENGVDDQTPKDDAQNQDGDKATRLPPVAVEGADVMQPKGYIKENTPTATKTETPLIEIPQSVSMITRKRMTDQNVQSVMQALGYSSGVQSAVFGVDTRADWFNLRGFPSSFSSLYMDGLRLSMPTGNLHLRMDPYGLDRIDVFKGPSSILYGQNTPGGMVNLVTKKPLSQPGRQAELVFGSFNRKQMAFDIGGPIEGEERLQYRVAAMGRLSDTQVNFVRDNRFFVAPSLRWQLNDKTSFTLLMHLQEDDSGNVVNFNPLKGTILPNPFGEIPTERFTGEPNFDQYDKTQASVGYQFEHEVNNALKVRQNFRYYYIDYTWKQIFGGGLQADNRTLNRFLFFNRVNADSFAVDTQVHFDFATGPLQHTLLAGVDQLTQRIDNRSAFTGAPTIDVFAPQHGQSVINAPPFSAISDLVQHQTGVYLQDQIKWNRWILMLSGRHDWASSETDNVIAGTTTEQDETAFTGRVGLVYRSEIGLAPYASYSESFNPVLGTNVFGQPFVPEEGKQIEFGIKYEPKSFDGMLTASVFDLRRQNVQNADPTNPLNTIQSGEIRSQGIEVEGAMSPLQGLDMVAAYTFLDMEVTKSTGTDLGKRPTQIPEHMASFWSNYTVQGGPLAGLGIGGGVRYTGTTFADSINTIKVPSYALFDAALQYRWSHWDLALNIQNVEDKTYAAACTAGACFFGARRNILGTVRYNW